MAAPLMTKEEFAQKMGLDLSKIDWAKWLGILQIIIGLLADQKPKMQAMKCPDHCALMHDTAQLNLQAAANCLECCEETMPGPP
jgi:hypothetical protein